MTPPKRKPGFQLPVLKMSQSQKGGLAAQIQSSGLSEAATERVLANTPSLRKLEQILARPIP